MVGRKLKEGAWKRRVFAGIILALTALAFTILEGCGGGDKGTGPAPTPSSSSIHGTWEVSSYKLAGQELPSDISPAGEVYIFNQNGTGSWHSEDGTFSYDYDWIVRSDSLVIDEGMIEWVVKHDFVNNNTMRWRCKDGTGMFDVEIRLAKQ